MLTSLLEAWHHSNEKLGSYVSRTYIHARTYTNPVLTCRPILSSGNPNTEIDAGDGMKKGFWPNGLSCFTFTFIEESFRDLPPKNFPLPLLYLSLLLPLLLLFLNPRSIDAVLQFEGLRALADISFWIWFWFWMWVGEFMKFISLISWVSLMARLPL